MIQGRPEWAQYYLNIAQAVSDLSDCESQRVGAVIAKREQGIISSGFNTHIGGTEKCRVLSGSVCASVHAEINALLRSAPHERYGAAMYMNFEPCSVCVDTLLSRSGLRMVLWPGEGAIKSIPLC